MGYDLFVVKEGWEKILRKITSVDGVLILTLAVGVTIILISLWRSSLIDRQTIVEFSSTTEDNISGKVVVDIEGAVMTPGVYELKSGSRIKDLLAVSGGLSGNADRIYCEKNLNLAEILKDGQKYYVPVVDKNQEGNIQTKTDSKKININTASVSQLDTLWGVGAVRAEEIVKNRPYGSVDELVKKGVVSKNIMEKNRDLLVVY